MKLAEALIERADIQRGMEELSGRITRNALHQEGEAPAEDPKELLSRFDVAAQELEDLIVRINETNNRVTLEDGLLMVAALAQRDVLKRRYKMYTTLAEEATPGGTRYSRSEIKYVSAVSVKAVQGEAGRIAKRLRELDMQIQQANWQHDLIE